MIFFILAIYLLGAIHVFATEMKIEKNWAWALFMAIAHPSLEAVGGILWIIVGIDRLLGHGFRRRAS